MRIGNNPQRDKKLNLGNFFHQIIIPIYIPHLQDYYKDSFEVFKICIQSIIKTSHKQTLITVVSNGSCEEVNEYIITLHDNNQIHDYTITKGIGKLNSILKGLVGMNLPLVTITDADVLFLNNWQKATYEVFEHFPKAGSVSLVPNPSLSFYKTANIFRDNIFCRKNIEYSKIKNIDAFLNFANSIGQLDNFMKRNYQEILTIKDSDNHKAVIGGGHFVATYKTEMFNFDFIKNTDFVLGGNSVNELLDDKPILLGLWRLSTEENFAFHLGNTLQDWVKETYNNLYSEENIGTFPKNTAVAQPKRIWQIYNNLSYRLFNSYKIRKLFILKYFK